MSQVIPLQNPQELYQKKEFDLCIAQCDKIIELDPSSYQAYHIKASAWVRLEKYNEALENYGKAILLNPNFSKAHLGKGIALVDKIGSRKPLKALPTLLN